MPPKIGDRGRDGLLSPFSRAMFVAVHRGDHAAVIVERRLARRGEGEREDREQKKLPACSCFRVTSLWSVTLTISANAPEPDSNGKSTTILAQHSQHSNKMSSSPVILSRLLPLCRSCCKGER